VALQNRETQGLADLFSPLPGTGVGNIFAHLRLEKAIEQSPLPTDMREISAPELVEYN
jgi:hypothetical protein